MVVVYRLIRAAASTSPTHGTNPTDPCCCFGLDLTKPCGHSIAIRCLPCGLAPGQHLSEISPTLSFLSGVCGATFCLVLGSSFPSENLPGANWPQHIKSFNFLNYFGLTGRWMPDATNSIRVCCGLLTQLSILAQCVSQTSPALMGILLSSVRSSSSAPLYPQ